MQPWSEFRQAWGRIPSTREPVHAVDPLAIHQTHHRLQAMTPADNHTRWLAGSNFVLRWIQRVGHRPACEERAMMKLRPNCNWMTRMVALGFLVSTPIGCAVAEEPTIDSSSTEAASDETGTIYLPEGYPETIMFPAGSKLVSASGGQPPEYETRNYNVTAETDLPVENVVEFYEGMLAKKGFDILEVEKGNATLIRFGAPGLDDASVLIMDMYGEGTTTFTISLLMEPEPE
jgi:hypothetical protein